MSRPPPWPRMTRFKAYFQPVFYINAHFLTVLTGCGKNLLASEGRWVVTFPEETRRGFHLTFFSQRSLKLHQKDIEIFIACHKESSEPVEKDSYQHINDTFLVTCIWAECNVGRRRWWWWYDSLARRPPCKANTVGDGVSTFLSMKLKNVYRKTWDVFWVPKSN